MSFVVWYAGVSIAFAQALSTPPQFDEIQLRVPDQLTMPSDAQIAPMTPGLRAPFEGILWSTSAQAWLITAYQAAQRLLLEEMQRRLDVTRAWAIRELETRDNRYGTDMASLRLQMSARDAQNADLVAINDDLVGQVGFTLREKMIVVVVTVGFAAVAGTAGYLIGRAGR